MSPTAEIRIEPYNIPIIAKIDNPAAARLLWRIREDMPVISAPIKMAPAMGIRGTNHTPNISVRKKDGPGLRLHTYTAVPGSNTARTISRFSTYILTRRPATTAVLETGRAHSIS
jgi:hypothetical protein